MSGPTTFEMTLERIALIRRMVVAWNPAASGAPIIHPDAPYGSADRDDDIANVMGDDDGTDEEHRALGDALAVFVGNATLKPGRYAYHNTLAKLPPGAVLDVFRDDETGITPEHITFDVTPEHITLLANLNLAWDEEHDVPGVDPTHPYGDGVSSTPDMASHPGTAPETDADGIPTASGARLPRLHREMQPALQIFLRYADLGPGEFRRAGTTERWEPA